MIAGLTEKELAALLLPELERLMDAEFGPLIARIERMENAAADAGPDEQPER